ncbi:MAG TPA: Mrp/NBP35 family ATP-binding protein [Syntrophales bacterium]|nr:Mrp/NBP35 family ATP-binding protein [Syntrophales bacterium]
MSNTEDALPLYGKGQKQQQENRDRTEKHQQEEKQLRERMAQIRHKILVLSGKGGVGKSTIAVNIAVGLGMEGKKVGLLDVDFHGPSIPTLLRLGNQTLRTDGKNAFPLDYVYGIKVVSLGLLLPDQDEAVIWRGPLKMGVIRQFLADIQWGDLDYLIIDFPPGTGDEPLSVAQMLPESDGAVIVTTPQEMSLADVRKSISFCRQVKVPVLGVVENMSGLNCPHCGKLIELFKTGGGESMAKKLKVPFLGRIPLEPAVVEASDSGLPFIYHYNQTGAAQAFREGIIKTILALDDR